MHHVRIEPIQGSFDDDRSRSGEIFLVLLVFVSGIPNCMHRERPMPRWMKMDTAKIGVTVTDELFDHIFIYYLRRLLRTQRFVGFARGREGRSASSGDVVDAE